VALFAFLLVFWDLTYSLLMFATTSPHRQLNSIFVETQGDHFNILASRFRFVKPCSRIFKTSSAWQVLPEKPGTPLFTTYALFQDLWKLYTAVVRAQVPPHCGN
jgi:hypothetical protein